MQFVKISHRIFRYFHIHGRGWWWWGWGVYLSKLSLHWMSNFGLFCSKAKASITYKHNSDKLWLCGRWLKWLGKAVGITYNHIGQQGSTEMLNIKLFSNPWVPSSPNECKFIQVAKKNKKKQYDLWSSYPGPDQRYKPPLFKPKFGFTRAAWRTFTLHVGITCPARRGFVCHIEWHSKTSCLHFKLK